MRATRVLMLVLAWFIAFAIGCKKDAVNKIAFKSALDNYYSSRQDCLWPAPVKFPAQADTAKDEQTKGSARMMVDRQRHVAARAYVEPSGLPELRPVRKPLHL